MSGGDRAEGWSGPALGRAERSVLQVIQPADGGAAEHVLRLSLGLRERGWRVDIATCRGSAIRLRLEEEGFAVHLMPLTRESGRQDLHVGRALRALDAQHRYDIVHAHSSKAGALVRAVLRATHRIVYTPHTFAFAHGFGRLRRRWYWAVEQALVHRCGAIVAVSDWERTEAGRGLRGAHGRTRVIKHGVPAPILDGAPDAEMVEFASGGRLIGTVTVLRAEKDPISIVRSAAWLAGHDALHARVAIVGDGPMREAVLSEIARLGVQRVVRWFPFSGTVGPHLRALDLFILPSLWESMPIAILEALSYGVPVLATNVGGVPEVVQDGSTGRLVRPGDWQELAAAIAALLDDPIRLEELGVRGRRLIESQFQVDQMVERTAALYYSLDGPYIAKASGWRTRSPGR